MHEIQAFAYKSELLEDIRNHRFGNNWPVVYILGNNKEAYIGETLNAFRRAKQHIENKNRQKLERFYIIADEEYNKSATLDIESSLIKYISADGQFLLQNANKGLLNHNYYDREKYRAKFELVWKDLQERGLVIHDLLEIENSDLFKFSPYKSLSEDQLDVVNSILGTVTQVDNSSHLVSGEPGTGKTVLAMYLIKRLMESKEPKDLTVALVVPMTSLRRTLKKVFKSIKGLKANMVIGPNQVVQKQYDILIVDEAHRLKRRKNIMGMGAFDQVNAKLGLLKYSGNQLDWIKKSSNHQVLFYDSKQSIKPSDIRSTDFNEYNFISHTLVSQMRIEGGEDYLEYVHNLFNHSIQTKIKFYNYDFKIFNNIHEMVDLIHQKEKEVGLARVVSGYAWEWVTKNDDSLDYDIKIDGLKLKWNSVTQDWVNSKNSVNEVGCIHTIQGYDLNYTGVIIGPEFIYDWDSEEFKVDKKQYKDKTGKRGIENEEELLLYIKNIYKTLMTRGIKGTYLYIANIGLRKYLGQYIDIYESCH
ncbi:DUF2075 domain-containing protein [bacterium]|nr:DUF2075 domain-containing protein [bacterium]